MNVVWIVGWGINPETLRAQASELSPGASVTLSRPSAEALSRAAAANLVVAWSYGAFLMLEATAQGRVFHGRVRLLAPFLAFCAEDQLGGRCARSQVNWLKRWLRKDPAAALADFAQRGGLPPEILLEEYPLDELTAGLDHMAAGIPSVAREKFESGLPTNWSACIGERDALLDAAVVARSLPGTQVIPEAGHFVSDLLRPSHAL